MASKRQRLSVNKKLTRLTFLASLALILMPQALAAEQSLFAGAHVVILTGLPGDVESEASYGNQLNQLLEIAASVEPKPTGFSLLVDSPDAVTPPAGIPTTVAKASRQGFVALRQELKDTKGPVVVFVWGHGGTIRGDPVFHVRGPRLEATDVASLARSFDLVEAEAETGRDSRWVLFFRGSGSFGKALSGKSRSILTSESDVMFRSDPIGMDIVLRVLKSTPSLSLEALSESLGEQTFHWYREQQLARTEEPTLWSGSAPPRLIAREAEVAFRDAEADSADLTARSSAENAWVGAEAPDFEIQTLGGDTIRLRDEIGKRVLILNFFATWCGPCKIEMPELVRFHEANRDKPLLFLGVDARESREDVEAFRDKYRVRYPIGIDDGTVLDSYDVGSFPTTVVVGLDGRILEYRVGMVRDAERSFAQYLDVDPKESTRNADATTRESERETGEEAVNPAVSSGASSESTKDPPEPTVTAETNIWKSIAPVTSARFPSAAAVVLRRSDLYVLGDNPAVSHERDEFIQILTEEGEALGDIDISFSPPGERLAFLDLEVRQPSGVILRLDPSEIREIGGRRTGDYRHPSRKMFSLPGVTEGSVMRIHYRSEWKRFPLPEVTLNVELQASVPMVSHEIELRTRRGSPAHFVRTDGLPSEPSKSESAYASVYRWSFEGVPALTRETLAPPTGAPELLVSTFPDWESFNAWYMRLIRDANTVTPEIERTASDITKGLTNPRAKVEALYNFVTSLRYVAIPLGVNSHRPHRAENVLANRYGDCKDKANLFNTLLKTQGIEADLVLVPRFSQAYEQTPGLGFNHAISRVRLDDDVIWADTTDEFARFGLLPPGDPGRNVLVIEESSDGLVPLPIPKANEHRLSLESTITMDSGETSSLNGELRVEVTGILDYMLRASAREVSDSGSTIPVVSALFRPSNGLFEQSGYQASSVAALDEAFEWKADGRFSGLVISLGDTKRLVQAPFWIPKEWELALHDRDKPLYLNQGYPFSLNEELTIRLPESAREIVLPARVSTLEDGPLAYQLEWTQQGQGASVRLSLELRDGELSLDETEAFQHQLRALLSHLSQGVTFSLSQK